jgi:hypothetical protein
LCSFPFGNTPLNTMSKLEDETTLIKYIYVSRHG